VKQCEPALGVAVLPNWLIREDLLSGLLVRVLPQFAVVVSQTFTF
jgi:DNA-binding transcriptional LysR family regulator